MTTPEPKKLEACPFPNEFSQHYDVCEECGPEGDIGAKRTYILCGEGRKLAVELLYPSFDEIELRSCAPKDAEVAALRKEIGDWRERHRKEQSRYAEVSEERDAIRILWRGAQLEVERLSAPSPQKMGRRRRDESSRSNPSDRDGEEG